MVFESTSGYKDCSIYMNINCFNNARENSCTSEVAFNSKLSE